MATSLNVMCAICSEFYNPDDRVYSTSTCGHLFHLQCLTRWFERSRSCPQCRRPCQKSRVHRVYLNFGERNPEDEGPDGVGYDGPNWIPLTWSVSDGVGDPEGAIKCGTDEDGNDAFVARVYYSEDILLPANYVPKKNGAYTPHGCNAHFTKEAVELLVDCNCKWVADRNGHVPPDAIVTGYTETGENLYTGRARYHGILLAGKVHPTHGVLYMPYKYKEVNAKEYEVLVHVSKAKEQAEEQAKDETVQP